MGNLRQNVFISIRFWWNFEVSTNRHKYYGCSFMWYLEMISAQTDARGQFELTTSYEEYCSLNASWWFEDGGQQ